MITNEILVSILQAYMSLSQHIRIGIVVRRNIASDLNTAAGWQQFCKKTGKRLRKKCLNIIIPFSIIVCCLVVA